MSGLDISLHPLGLLPRLIEIPALHDPLHDGAGIDILKLVMTDLAVDTHHLGCSVDVGRGWHERRRPVVDSVGGAPWERAEVLYRGDERGAEDDGVNVLQLFTCQ